MRVSFPKAAGLRNGHVLTFLKHRGWRTWGRKECSDNGAPWVPGKVFLVQHPNKISIEPECQKTSLGFQKEHSSPAAWHSVRNPNSVLEVRCLNYKGCPSSARPTIFACPLEPRASRTKKRQQLSAFGSDSGKFLCQAKNLPWQQEHRALSRCFQAL